MDKVMSTRQDAVLSTVGLVVRPGAVPAVVGTLEDWATARGIQLTDLSRPTVGAPGAESGPGRPRPDPPPGLVIGAGGDGTVLSALHLAAGWSEPVPVLGVNIGHLGFLTAVDPAGLPALLDRIARYGASGEQLRPLEVSTTTSDQPLVSERAFNDFVLTRVPGRGEAAFALRIDGRVFARFAADGVVVATAAGSTAYSYSAGGPIVSPGVDALVVTPVAPHGNFRSPLILPRGDGLSIDVMTWSAPVVAEVDGQARAQLMAGSSVDLSLGTCAVTLVRADDDDFYDRVRRKLGVVDPPELIGRETPS
jgi:NAD+ kinase